MTLHEAVLAVRSSPKGQAHPSCRCAIVSEESGRTLLVNTIKLSKRMLLADASTCCGVMCARLSSDAFRMVPIAMANNLKLLLL